MLGGNLDRIVPLHDGRRKQEEEVGCGKRGKDCLQPMKRRVSWAEIWGLVSPAQMWVHPLHQQRSSRCGPLKEKGSCIIG